MKTVEQKAIDYANENTTIGLSKEMAVRAYIAGTFESLSSQWRSVDDELPDENTLVLCRMKNTGAIVSGFITKRWRPYPEGSTLPNFHFEDYGGYECTHWMPLPPNTPEEDEQD